ILAHREGARVHRPAQGVGLDVRVNADSSKINSHGAFHLLAETISKRLAEAARRVNRFLNFRRDAPFAFGLARPHQHALNVAIPILPLQLEERLPFSIWLRVRSCHGLAALLYSLRRARFRFRSLELPLVHLAPQTSCNSSKRLDQTGIFPEVAL